MLTGEEVKHSPLARYEARAGEIVALKLITDFPLVRDEEAQRRVDAVGRRLAAQALRKEIPYRFAVVAAAEPNAFAVAGGNIFITRPLLELCGGGADCLAGVLGHEVIHVDQRHALRQLATSVAVQGGMRIFSLGGGAILARLVGGMEQLLVQGYRQDQEFEADRFGSRLARLAGFDPRGLEALLERLAKEHPDGTGPLAEISSYFKSHPPIRARIARLRREV
jgi:predicted Zn-dependent protease